MIAPSLQVLMNAESANVRLGHENLGYLSSNAGFMPLAEPLLQFPATFEPWDKMMANTPVLYQNQAFRKAMDAMPLLAADSASLPDIYLQRASLALSFFAHAYARAGVDELTQDDLPECIMSPWREVSRRLGRKEPFMSYFDLIAYNWMYKNPNKPTRDLEHMQLMYPIFDCKEEQVLYLTQTEMMAKAAPMVRAVADAQDAVLKDDYQRLREALEMLHLTLDYITNVSFAKLSYMMKNTTGMDAVVFTKTMMSFAVPIKDGVPGPSGTAFPYVHLLDAFLGREHYDAVVGREAMEIRRNFPPHVRRFLSAVGKVSVLDYLQKKEIKALRGLYSDLLNAYSGPKGFLNIHRKRVYSFIQTSFKVGRPQTIGGFEGGGGKKEWQMVDDALEDTRGERPRCPFSGHPLPDKEEKKRRYVPRKAGPNAPKYPLSHLAAHSDSRRGYWVLVNGCLYDVTRYVDKHPGGEVALLEYAGSDASEEFQRMHHDSRIAQRMLDRFFVGMLDEPRFPDEGIAQLWQAIRGFLFKVVELHNTYRLEVGVGDKPCFPGEDTSRPSPYKKWLKEGSERRFVENYKVALINAFKPMVQWMLSHRADLMGDYGCPLDKRRKGEDCPFWTVRGVEEDLKFLERMKDQLILIVRMMETGGRLSPNTLPVQVEAMIKDMVAHVLTK